MNVEQLLLVLPHQAHGSDLPVNNWAGVVDEFAAQGGRELLLGGVEPLAYPGFWVIARRGLKLHVPRVTAYLSGSLLEPWVMRPLVESGVHLLVALDSLQPEVHDAMHGHGSHARAMGALEHFLKQGMAPRVGILATATRLSQQELPMLAAWAAGRGLSRFLWSTAPDGGWPSPQLRSLRLSPEEKNTMVQGMAILARSLSASLYMGPLDGVEEPSLYPGYARLLRVGPQGEANWGFSGEGGRLGNVRRGTMKDMLERAAQAAGD